MGKMFDLTLGENGGGGGGGELPELTEEHVVGTLNGKPVYELLIEARTPAAGTNNIYDTTALNVKKIIMLTGVLYDYAGEGKSLALNFSPSSTDRCNLQYNEKTGYVQTNILGNYCVNKSCNLTIRYTKTTD